MKKRKEYPVGGVRREIYDGFQFLVTEYAFELEDVVDESGFFQLVFKNATTGVVVEYENREQYIEIMLYQLVGGKIVKNLMSALSSNEKITGFSLDYMIKKTSPEDLVLPVHQYGDDSKFYKEGGFREYVALSVNNLKKHATHILHGDFSSFERLDKEFREDYSNNRKRG